METVLQSMATNVSPLLKVLAPEAFSNMVGTVIIILVYLEFQFQFLVIPLTHFSTCCLQRIKKYC